MNDFERDLVKEEAFLKRYNREVEVWVKIWNKDKYTVKLIHPKKTFLVTEQMDRGLPKETTLEYDSKTWKHKLFVFAEIQVADEIGRL